MNDPGAGAADARAPVALPPSSPMSLADATAVLTATGQFFEMQDVAVRGVTTRVWKSAPTSLQVVLDLSLAHGEADFLVYEGERITFAQHYAAVATLGHRLMDRFGVGRGDRVAIAMRNLPEWVMAFWAIVSIGAVAVPLNAWWTADELKFALADSGSVLVFTDRERAQRIRGATDRLPDLQAVIVADEHRSPAAVTISADIEHAFTQVLGTGGSGELGLGGLTDTALPAVVVDPDDDATIFYTSGTTGRPKGAVGTHRNATSNLMSLFFLNERNQLRFGTSLTGAQSGQGSCLLSVPLFHVTGCHAIMIGYAASGGRLVMMHHFDPLAALQLIERERVTNFGGVPTMVLQVLDSPELANFDVSSIRSVSYGGAPAPTDLIRRIHARLPTSQPSNGYGLTETSATTTMNSGPDYVARPDSVGVPVPVSDVAVVPDGFAGDEPNPVPLGTASGPGELWIKGPQVVRGYWGRPEETARSFSRGWLHTGDVARIDEEGFVYIVDRAKDVIIRGGENVYSAEVEAVLDDQPAVAEAAVVGVPHPVLGEEVGAFVVLRPGAKVAADELAAQVRLRLAPFNVPSRWWFRSTPLPRNVTGKLLKAQLRRQVLEPDPLSARGRALGEPRSVPPLDQPEPPGSAPPRPAPGR